MNVCSSALLLVPVFVSDVMFILRNLPIGFKYLQVHENPKMNERRVESFASVSNRSVLCRVKRHLNPVMDAELLVSCGSYCHTACRGNNLTGKPVRVIGCQENGDASDVVGLRPSGVSLAAVW